MRTLAMVAALVVVGCDAPTYPAEVPAYDPTALTGGVRYRWTSGRVIHLYADTVATPAGFAMDTRLASAASRWNVIPRYRDFELRLTSDVRQADVVVRFRQAPSRVDLGACEPPGSGAGRTAFCTDVTPARILPLIDGSGGRVKVDVYVDPTSRTAAELMAFGMTPEQYFEALLVHELGHVLGIGGHSDDPTDVMTGGFIRVTKPSANDARTLRAVWRQPADLLL